MFEQNEDIVKIVIKHLPLRSHRMAGPAALASMAAHEQGKFWQYHDRLYAEAKITPDSIERIARDLDLDMEKFKRDAQSASVRQQVARDVREAERLGVRGTPTIFVNGKRLKRRSLEGFQQAIAEARK